jgi:chromosome partitioning protein
MKWYFGSHKGGVGKTSQLTNIAACLRHKLPHKKIAVLESDDQRSFKKWLDERAAQDGLIDIDYFECYTNIEETANRLDKRYDIVLMDAPGRKSAEFRKCLAVADRFISFIDPSSQIEIDSLGELVADVKKAQASVNKSLQAMVVMNKCPTEASDTDASTFRKAMNNDPDWLPVARQRLYYRKAYKVAYNKGLAVHEYNDRRGNKARGEIELMLAEIGLL